MKTAAAILAALIAFTLGLLSCTPPANSAESTPGVTYSAHVQRIGWQAPVDDGATAGTTGRALRLEALRLSPSGGATLAWRGHVQKVGWQKWRDTPGAIGTTGKGLRLEAFQITVKDSGQLYGDVSVEYRAHVQGIGWQPWRRDGQTAGTTGKGLRVEAVQIRIVQGPEPEPTASPTSAAPAPSVTPSSSPAPAPATTLAFTADTGLASTGKAVLAKIGATNPDATTILGDLGYAPNSAGAFCEQTNARITGPGALVLAGNHEEMGSEDGYIDQFAECLPAEVPITGTYAREYFFDRGNVRTILVSPDIEFIGPDSRYGPGDAGRTFLVNAIRDAKAKGMWTIVGMHHPCFTLGMHGCGDTTSAVSNIALAEGVDLVFSGHEHNYMRTHPLAGSVESPRVVDTDGDITAGAGTVFTVVGNGGHNPRTVGAKTPLWAVANGTNSPGGFAFGFGEVTVAGDVLTYRHVSAGGAPLADTFTITRR